jgi:hypothetical protein
MEGNFPESTEENHGQVLSRQHALRRDSTPRPNEYEELVLTAKAARRCQALIHAPPSVGQM